MKLIILCGGKGERFPGSYPKPLNRIWGRMLGEWLAESINTSFYEVYWIINPILKEYSIHEEIIRWWKGGVHHIVDLPFETREPGETLTIGLQQLLKAEKISKDDDILVIDNDNYYDSALNEFLSFKQRGYESGILVGNIPETNSARYGFVKHSEGSVVEAREKEIGWGENSISYGGYWFNSIESYLKKFNSFKSINSTYKEISLLNLIAYDTKRIGAVMTDATYPLGTPEDCKYTYLRNPNKFGWKCRVVVDLDNTLVSYPTKVKDYSSCIEKKEITEWIRQISSEGAKVIVSTARRMETNDYSLGKMIKNDGIQTLQQIQSLSLGESEINLGKCLGDIYLDDRSINPYSSDWKIMAGDWSELVYKKPTNFLGCTRDIKLYVDTVKWIIKKGSVEELKGQTHFYKILNSTYDKQINEIFVKCYDIKEEETSISLYLENINGTPGCILLNNNLIGKREWTLLFNTLDTLHSHKEIEAEKVRPTREDITYQWYEKIEDRIQKYRIYKIVDENLRTWNILQIKIKEYILNAAIETCFIHGDLWMSNIIFTSKSIKLIDMRGQIKNKYTVYGDKMYDWAKLGTSFLGMDDIVFKFPKKNNYHLFEQLRNRLDKDNQKYLLWLSLSLMYSSLWVYDVETAKQIVESINKYIKYTM